MAQPEKPILTEYEPYYDDSEPASVQLPDDNDTVDTYGTSAFEKPITDRWIHAEINLPQGESMQNAKVIGRATDQDGNVIGTYGYNPYSNTMVYDVEFPDVEIKEYSVNEIAENMYAQVDAEGFSHSLLDSILDFKKDVNAVDKEDMYVTNKSGQYRVFNTTAGWKLLFLWNNGTEKCIPLSVMKNSKPVEVAQFEVARGVDREPDFSWWVPYNLSCCDRIISGVNSRVKRVTHKYGVELPRTVQEAYALDDKNGNTFWSDVLNKEMENLKVYFDILPEGKSPPPGYFRSSGRIIFYVRMTIERKDICVKYDPKTPEPSWSTYAGVISRESIIIALTYALLNNLPVFGYDIQNAYLQALTTEKHYIICGPEFGLENVGKKELIVCALYGGNYAGANYWRHVRAAMDEMGFLSCKTDPDLWM